MGQPQAAERKRSFFVAAGKDPVTNEPYSFHRQPFFGMLTMANLRMREFLGAGLDVVTAANPIDHGKVRRHLMITVLSKRHTGWLDRGDLPDEAENMVYDESLDKGLRRAALSYVRLPFDRDTTKSDLRGSLAYINEES